MNLPYKIISNIRTNSKYGLVNPDDELVVGKDIDEVGAERWLENGIARRADLKVKPETPTMQNTKKEIVAYLKNSGIEHDKSETKQELLDRI